MYIMNKTGPNTRGIPDNTGFQSETLLLRITRCPLFVREFSNQCNIFPLIPKDITFYHNALSGTVSDAF